MYLDLTDEAVKLLSECHDFKGQIVDKLDPAVTRIASGAEANGATPSPCSVMKANIVDDHFDEIDSSNPKKERLVTQLMRSSSGREDHGVTFPPLDEQNNEDDEFSSLSFGTGEVIDVEDSYSSSRVGGETTATAGIASSGCGPEKVSICAHDQWPFNIENWDTDSDGDNACYLHGDKLLLIGALMVQQLRSDVMRECGYTCSGGIAHTKMLSKVGAISWLFTYTAMELHV